MCFICQTQHSCVMGHLHNGTKIAADSIIGRVIYQHCNCLGMLFYGLLNLFPAHSQGYSKSLIHFRIYINRDCAAQNKGI